MRIYLAGPLGFSEAGRAFHQDIVIPEISRLGHTVLDPWQLTELSKISAVEKLSYGADRRDAWRSLNNEIGENNAKAIDECDVVFAVLDGVDVDSGTAAEIGYAFARHKPILGYRSDFRLSGDNEGARVNLQVEYFVTKSGGTIIDKISALPEALETIVSGVEVNGHGGMTKATTGNLGQMVRDLSSRETATNVILLILLALIVKAALEATFQPVFELGGGWSRISPLSWGQVAVFFVMTLRFFVGATRYVRTEPENIDFVSKAVNFGFAFVLFSTFYAIALAVVRTEFFYVLMVILHGIDAIWFSIALLCIWHLPDTKLRAGEIRRNANMKVMATYLAFDLGTIGLALGSYYLIFQRTPSDPTAIVAHWVFLGILLALSLLDFAVLHDFYFNFDAWHKRSSVGAP